MGGVLIIAAVLLSTLLWADLGNRFIWIVVFICASAIGWLDTTPRSPELIHAELVSKQSFLASVAAFTAAVALCLRARNPPQRLRLLFLF